MPPAPPNPWLTFVEMALFAASLVTWIKLAKRARHGPLLPFEQRELVPWGAAGPVLMMLFVLSRVATVALGEESSEFDINQIVSGVFLQLALFGSFFAAIAVMSRATLRDIGLPKSATQFFNDVKLGGIAWLAAMIPVFGLQALLVGAGEEPSSHPLIQIVLKEPNWVVLSLAFVSAVIVAPLSEEIVFRLVVQGWLEKLEDELLGWRRIVTPPSTEEVAEPVAIVQPTAAETLPPKPPTRGLLGLPYGWLPILMSAALFAAAHIGHGPDPIPLFVLALILGYLYQRTHRILPCIVTHLLFNLTTLVTLILLIVFGGGEMP